MLFRSGTYIEALNKGANVLIQMGGGCRYGYYSELQIEILKNLDYKFEYINLVNQGKADIKKIIKKFKKLDPKFSKLKTLYYLLITIKMIKYMDKIDDYIRQNIGFEQKKDSFIDLKNKMLNDFANIKGYFDLKLKYLKYKRKFKKLEVKKDDYLKVGIIGELYTVMEPFANYELEKELARDRKSVV